MKRFAIALVLVSFLAHAGIREEEDELARQQAKQMMDNLKRQNEERERRKSIPPYPDAAQGNLPRGADSRSDWKESEQARYAALLDGRNYDVLVVPFQVQGQGIDRANRSLMTALLASALPATLALPNPYLVARALGDGERSIDRRKVIDLANRLRVGKIIWSYVGHQGDDRLHLYFEVLERQGDTLIKAGPAPAGTLLKDAVFDDAIPPIAAFRQALPRVLEALGYPASAAPVAISAAPLPRDIPTSLAALTHAGSTPAADALSLQWLASLLPLDAERERERLFERSLLLAWQLPPGQPGTRLLLARAYFGLGLRPAALAALGAPAGDEEQALQATLNGNLPDLERHRARIPLSPQRLLAEIDASDMRLAYGGEAPERGRERADLVAALKQPWAALLARRLADSEPSRLQGVDDITPLRLLGSEFPEAGPPIDQRLRGRQVAGKVEAADLDKALGAYLDPALVKDPYPPCCTPAAWRLHRRDVLEALVEAGIANMVYKLRRLAIPQGLYREALQYAAELEPMYAGHPGLAVFKAVAERTIANQTRDETRHQLHQRAAASEHQALLWSQGQSPLTAYASHLALSFAGDRPQHPGYWLPPAPDKLGPMPPAYASALANSTFQTGALRALSSRVKTDADRQALLRAVAGRFDGDGTVSLVRADGLFKSGMREEAKAALYEALKPRPWRWTLYSRLGGALVEEGKYDEAARVFGRFPGFSEAGSNPVAVAGDASEAGSLFFWRGDFDHAEPLLRIAAELDTGSHASIASAARLALLHGAYEQAAVLQFQAAQRYNQSLRYRDYLALLHMLDQGAPAWDGFRALLPQFDNADLWDSALVGHRREGLDEGQLIAWAQRPEQKHALAGDVNLTARYLVLSLVTDRIPGADAAAAVDALERPVFVGRRGEQPAIARNSLDNGPAPAGAVAADKLPAEGLKAGVGTRIRSELAYFTAAYRALKLGQPGEAAALFRDASRYYRLAAPANRHMLPYYALAAVQAGDEAPLLAILAEITVDQQHMDYWLARSVVGALKGQPGAADQFRQALNKRAFTELRPLGAEYALADVAEQLFDATHNREFRDLALQVARFNQKTQPWEAWSYGVEAKLADSPADRRRAIARLLYLDRNSERLSRLPAQEREAAATTSGKGSPFRQEGGARRSI